MRQSHGHINPFLPLVRELVERGDEVVHDAADRFATQIKGAGGAVRAADAIFAFTR